MKNVYLFILTLVLIGCDGGELANYPEYDKLQKIAHADSAINNERPTPNILIQGNDCFFKKDGIWSFVNSEKTLYIKYMDSKEFCFERNEILWLEKFCTLNERQKKSLSAHECKENADSP